MDTKNVIAAVNKILFIKISIFNLITKNKDNKNEIRSNTISLFLIMKSDLIHFSFGPMAIINKKGIKNGIINL